MTPIVLRPAQPRSPRRAAALATAFCLLAAALLAGCAGDGAGGSTISEAPAETLVQATGGDQPGFAPAEVTVGVGDTVTFRVLSGRHTVDFDASRGLSNNRSGDLGLQTPFAVRFTEPGTYTYRCAYHADVGMTGRVVVVP